MKRSSAKAESGQRFKTVVELLAMVAARVEPSARMKTAKGIENRAGVGIWPISHWTDWDNLEKFNINQFVCPFVGFS